ncbi:MULTISPECIES: ABC transporter permease [Halorussus]|uniref:ABC transporter permease n=1 Tax=Halorussus TaxID=1070314 RepID=UPI00209F71FA|nr:ABC transporter permease subunit [Halorussus vallis]USZ75844.1 ABC transporter permease [Halorussus vallis]
MTSTPLIIAKKEFADAARSKLLWGLTLVLLVVTVPNFFGMTDGPILDDAANAVTFFPLTFQNFVAPLVMIAAYRAVVGERESGSLRVLFGHPVTRRDVVVGKLLGRIALVAVVLLIGTLALGVVVVAAYGTLPIGLFVVMAAYIVAYGAVWTAVTVGVSAAVSSRLQAIATVLGLFMFFGPFPLWKNIGLPLVALVATGSASTAGIDQLEPSTWPTWYLYAQRLNPMENFVESRTFVASLADPSIGYLGDVRVQLFGIAVLVVWVVVPLAVGYWQFERTDLT